MTPQHFFLSGNTGTPSPRWFDAFPSGKVLASDALAAGVAGLGPQEYIVWLSADDAAWLKSMAFATQALPGVRLVVLSGAPEPDQGLAALDAGAMGYSHTYALPEVLQEVATVVAHGGLWAGPDLIRRLVASTTAALGHLPAPAQAGGIAAQNHSKAWDTLSAREAQVAACVAEGKSNLEVAEQLFISERTVKAHLGAVFEKLAIRDRLQLAVVVAAIGPKARSAAKAKAKEINP